MFEIRFVRQNITFPWEGGLLSDACAKAGLPLNLVCGGRGTCGKCRVKIVFGGQEEEVLACQKEVDCDMDVWLTDDQISRSAAIMTEGTGSGTLTFSPAVTKRCCSRDELVPEHCGAYLDIRDIRLLRDFSLLMADSKVREVTFVDFNGSPVGVEAGNTTDRIFGGAVDIGTTSVVLYAYDLTNGKLLSTKSELNGQIARGADVISRILHTMQEPGGLDELTGFIHGTINGLIERVEEEVPGYSENLYHMVLCGNSTMQHLFLGLNPTGLSADPFVNVTAEHVRIPSFCSGLRMAKCGTIEFLPLLGGFVGADTSAVLLSIPKEKKPHMMVDLGTNGEIGVSGPDGYMVASTACGPALEGGNIACGMRGTNGAIEKISLADGQVRIRVIGGEEPIGLCGSAIIDAVAELLRAGIIDPSGRMLTREEYEEAHPGSTLSQYLGESEPETPAFFFTRGEQPVYLNQHDVRQIQLAKSSIYSGCVTLVAEAGLSLDDIEAFYLAGAFGNYIDVDNALYIGLLPPIPRERIISVGNGAGQGVQLCLLDSRQTETCKALADTASHLELAATPMFMEEYIMNMNFNV